MNRPNNQTDINKIKLTNNKSDIDKTKVLSEFTRRDIEKSYSLEAISGTEAYFSERYGWILRKTMD